MLNLTHEYPLGDAEGRKSNIRNWGRSRRYYAVCTLKEHHRRRLAIASLLAPLLVLTVFLAKFSNIGLQFD